MQFYRKRLATALALVWLSLLLVGCSQRHIPPVPVFPAAEVSPLVTILSNATLSYEADGRKISGSGVFMYQKPDQIHAVILTPFGSVYQEVFVRGNRITIVDPANAIAFDGEGNDLPDKGNFGAWRYIQWFVDIDLPDRGRGTCVIHRSSIAGTEQAAFENGFLTAKLSNDTGNVTYKDYVLLNNSFVPLTISYQTVLGEKFTIQLEEPEINLSLEEKAFQPNLKNMRVFPLNLLQ